MVSKSMASLQFDSNEEKYFSWWLTALIDRGFISDYKYQPKPFPLSEKRVLEYRKALKTKVNVAYRELLSPHQYTPDFTIYWTEDARHYFHKPIDSIDLYHLLPGQMISHWSNRIDCHFSIVDVKGNFNQNDAWRRFSIDQKWVFEKYGFFVNKVIPVPTIDKSGKVTQPNALFHATFTPNIYMLTDKTKKPRLIRYKLRTLDQFLAERLKLLTSSQGIMDM